MCKTLRVLNAVRNPEIGIPLSIQQYKVFKAYWIQSPISKLNLHAISFELNWISLLPQLLTPSVLIGRLINAHQHLLALRISEYLGMNQVSLYNLYGLCSYDRFVLFNFIFYNFFKEEISFKQRNRTRDNFKLWYILVSGYICIVVFILDFHKYACSMPHPPIGP